MTKTEVRALEVDEAAAAASELDAAEAFAFDPARKRKEVKFGFSIAEGHLTRKVAQPNTSNPRTSSPCLEEANEKGNWITFKEKDHLFRSLM